MTECITGLVWLLSQKLICTHVPTSLLSKLYPIFLCAETTEFEYCHSCLLPVLRVGNPDEGRADCVPMHPRSCSSYSYHDHHVQTPSISQTTADA
jgi:hypothetical protein